MDGFKIENISYTTIKRFKYCFEKNGSPKDEKKLIWQFLQTPVQDQYVDIAIDKESDKTAAIYAIFPVKFFLDSQEVVGSQSLDTMTDKDFRGKGLFVNLAKDVYNKASKNNVKLVYGFPNGNSIHGFTKKLEWNILDPVPFLIKPLKTKFFTKKISALSWFPNINLKRIKEKITSDRYILESKNEFPIQVNDIWKSFSKSFKVAVNRDKEYLDWRYLNKPFEDYKIVHAYSKENEYLGFVVFAVKEKHGGKIGYIMELIYDVSNHNIGKLLLKYAVNEINKSGSDCILSWCLEHSPNYSSFSSLSFYKMPEKLRPIELHFGARSFDKNFSEIINNRQNWYLSYSDSDTV